ncbi:MAG: hypothetical protein Q8P25_05290 [Candidatus Curtissbacteria bacterium]|nr:hypothetical protein [Candidatus Curtissbacteria bacterium]
MKKLPLLVFVFAVFCGLIIFRAAWFTNDRHFSILALSFLHNDLFLSPANLPNGDYVDYFGKQYLFFGPMPSILLIPFAAVWGRNFQQMVLSFSSLVIIFFSIFRLCRRLKFNSETSFWLCNFFVFGTVLYFVGLVNISAYVVQAVGVAFVVLSLMEYFGRRRWFLVGLLVGAAVATRITLIGMAVFYILEIVRNFKKINVAKSVALFLIPIIFSAVMLGIYNFKRFHNVFDTGYTKNVSILDKNYYNYKLGFFNPIHIPANLYEFIFKSPEPVMRDGVEFTLKFPYLKADGFGMGILFTSPLFIYLLLAKKEEYTISAVVAIVILLIPSLLYWGIGSSQYGYRYSLDFLPLLFLILTSAFKNGLGNFAKALIVFGIVFNCFYMLSIWDTYPLLNFWVYLD